MFNKFINKFKFLKKTTYLKVRPYLNATKKPAEVRMGKGKGKFDKKIVPMSAGTEILEVRIIRAKNTNIEDWGKKKVVFLKDSLPALRKLSCKLPVKTLIVRPYLNATKKPAEVRMGKGKGKFDKKIVPMSAGTEILEVRIIRAKNTNIEDWGKKKVVFLKDSLPALRKLSCKLPVKTIIVFNDF